MIGACRFIAGLVLLGLGAQVHGAGAQTQLLWASDAVARSGVAGLTVPTGARLPLVSQAGVGSLPAQPDGGVGRVAGMTPVRLRCEYRVDPLGIDSAQPRLDWILRATASTDRGLTQSAYRLLVASSPEKLAGDEGDLWDSGKVMSGQMSQVDYAGKPLQSDQLVWWKVKVWDQTGTPSGWSVAAHWTMGVLTSADWQAAKWIGAPTALQPVDHGGPLPKYETVLLRREFTVQPGLMRATVNVCGLGQYEMTLNGAKVGRDLLSPGWTRYDKTCLYDTYDITAALQAGRNAMGLFLGNGFFNIHGQRYIKIQDSFGPVQAIARIRMEYRNGKVETLVSDGNWKAGSGPITFSSIYGGEDYDARLVQDGWDKAGFDDASWSPAAVTNGPGGALKGLSCAGPPVRSFDVLKPVGQHPLGPGVTVYDLGQNAALMLRLKVRGPAGSVVKVTPSELVNAQGDIQDDMCGGNSYWTYILSGKGEEDYVSNFYYRGGRYLKVELSAAPGGSERPELTSIEGDTIHADAPAVGEFSCSNDRFDKIYTLVRWAQMNNMMSVMTDCPTREKLGWLEEDHLNGPSLRYNFDLSTLLGKLVNDMADSQRPDGLVPSTCPDYPRWDENNGFCNPTEWGSACIVVPWQQYQFGGDVELLRQGYPMMKRYVDFISTKAKDNIVDMGLGDWCANQQTPNTLTATAFYYYDAKTMGRVAALLGHSDDAGRYDQLAEQIRNAFNREFFVASSTTYATSSQGSYAVPLAFELAEAAARPAVLNRLLNDRDLKQGNMLAGEVCLESLINALGDAGHSDLVYSLFNTNTSGYGLQVKLGKTSLTENWDGGDSQDHFMFGQINEWFFRDLAGIQLMPGTVGFTKIYIGPAVVGDLTWVKASYDSISGKIVSEWKREGNELTLHVIIPPNTTARIAVPTDQPESVREGGRPVAQISDLHVVSSETGRGNVMDVEAGSGDYIFTSTMPAAPPPPPQGGDFADGFNGNKEKWQEGSGSWQTNSGFYSATSNERGTTSIREKPWTDATYTFSVKIDDAGGGPTNWAGLAFRKGSPSADVWSDGGYLLFLRANGEFDLYNGSVIQAVKTNLDTSKPVKFKVVTAGDEIKVFLNDETTPRMDVHDHAFADGYAGFQTYYTKATFGPIAVKAMAH